MEVEFKFHRCSCKLSFLFSPPLPDPLESFLAGQSFIPQPSIERRSRHYVTFPWKQTFWMTTNRKRHQKKVNSHCLKLHGSYSVSFNLSNVGEIIFLGLNPKGPHLRLDKEKENFSVVFTNSIKTKSGCVKLGSFISQSCNDGYKKA